MLNSVSGGRLRVLKIALCVAQSLAYKVLSKSLNDRELISITV